jgi:ABC-type bacteriocin/lantibiotic exporter with double-glycine peptidase domain
LATIALLGYVFNFSVIYSDFALEACYMIVVLTRRIDTIVIENIKYQAENIPRPVVEHERSEVSIKMEDVTSIWSPTSHAQGSAPPLENITLDIDGPKKVAIIGRVGCGKTTLL